MLWAVRDTGAQSGLWEAEVKGMREGEKAEAETVALSFLKKYLFAWLLQVLGVAHGIFEPG